MEVIELGPLIVKLSALFGAAVLIERFLVIVNGVLNRLFIIQTSIRYQEVDYFNGQMKLAMKATEEEKVLDDPNQAQKDPREIEPNPNHPFRESNFDILKISSLEEETDTEKRFEILKRMNKVRKEFWMQLFGTVIGIIACYYSKFSIWVFVTSAIKSVPVDSVEPAMWEFAFTGVIIGSSSKPINFLMNFLLNRKIEIKRTEVREKLAAPIAKANVSKNMGPQPQAAVPVMSVKPMTIEEIVGFDYDGGDRPERLEHTHIFKKKVDLIVYHHTAMHSDSPFEELVKEFDRKGWLTGYNCVVFKDGSIRALCRWDRFGNHARPHNSHSLGIALQGNFETNASVPYSNHDGRYGIKAPTNKQVDGMARITALWSLMHEIDLKFPSKDEDNTKYIVPHKHIAPKACPGNSFPYKTFERKVTYYYEQWSKDETFGQALEEFKEMPYVMPNY
ncbi:MAG: peptidoglycan recognition family protein [Bacteroidota bacterium]